MSDHSFPGNLHSTNLHAANPTLPDVRRNNDEVESDEPHHQLQLQLTEENISTPDSLKSDAASETLVYLGHPLQVSPSHSYTDGFSPYNESSGSSQQYPSPCLRLAPNIRLNAPCLLRSSPPNQVGQNILPWRSLPPKLPLNKSLRAVLSFNSSSIATSPASSTTSIDRRKVESLQVVPMLRPDQLGFSEFGFTPLPLTGPPLNQSRQVRKLASSRNAREVLIDVARIFGTLDEESRAKFAAEIGQIVGLGEHEEGYREGTEDTSTAREDEEEESDR